MKPITVIILALAMAATPSVSFDARTDHVRLESRWRDREILIDGSDAEWPGPLLQIDRKTPVAIAAANDGQFLYLVLTASDPTARAQILRQGLIVWFDPEGKSNKHFGIKYPVGMMMGAGGRGGRGGQGGYGGGRGRPSGGGTPPEEGQDDFGSLEPPNRLEVLGPKKDDARSFVTDRAPGMEVKVGQAEGSLVYELKVPIATTTEFEYAIGAKPGALIGIGLETPKMESSPREGMTGGGMGGGLGGRGGSGRGGGDRGGGGGRGMGGGGRAGQERASPMKAWGLIQLAAK